MEVKSSNCLHLWTLKLFRLIAVLVRYSYFHVSLVFISNEKRLALGIGNERKFAGALRIVPVETFVVVSWLLHLRYIFDLVERQNVE